ncbi:MAG TPA: undecaprenyl-phosphate glucose phosphotransferase [Xanthobacteraceae bacterium]|nr:undecaprenyl-phosphate glucose phosphotransferase [Xanthobacteraceae bacterium]
MSDFETHNSVHAAAAIASAPSSGPQMPTRPRSLSPEALAIASQHAPPSYSAVVVTGLVRIVEFLLIAAVGSAVYAAYVLPANPFGWHYPFAIGAIAGLCILGFQTVGIYRLQSFRSRALQFARLLSTWSLVFLLFSAVIFFGKWQDLYSRVWLLSFYLTGAAALVGFRILLLTTIRNWTREGRLNRRTVVVGGGELAETLLDQFARQRDSDLRILGLFDDRNDERSPHTIGGQRKLGTVDDLVEFARRTPLDLVIFALPITAETRILQMLRKLWVLPVDIRLAAHMNKLKFRPHSYSYLGDVPVLDVFDRPIAGWDVVVKWLFDKFIGGLLLLACLPLMAVVALAVKLESRGPVLFKQKRYGFNNELIEIYKFRSMYADQADATAARLVTKDDPRVTRVGRILRKTSLDELPQLFNVVIKGNLSLVGPRPHAVNAKAEQRRYDEAVDGYFARHRVKPGITGWAQINGWRGETDTAEKIQARVEHDLYYIENWSLLFDFYILARTPFALLKTENAY